VGIRSLLVFLSTNRASLCRDAGHLFCVILVPVIVFLAMLQKHVTIRSTYTGIRNDFGKFGFRSMGIRSLVFL
jgi:hypothetical protein